MRTILFVLLLLPALSFTQDEGNDLHIQPLNEALLKYGYVLEPYESDFDVNEAPEKWKDESAVILNQTLHLLFQDKDEGALVKGTIRKRTLIQDKSELETFTEFYFQDGEVTSLTHVKADGTENEIDLAKAIKVETEIPAYYRDGYHSDVYYKIAIPNLEVGDILDYFKVFTEFHYGNVEIIQPITSEYPILKKTIILDANKQWTVYNKTFNLDGEFVLDPKGGLEKKGKKRSKKVRRFVLQVDDMESSKYERWSYPVLTTPAIKVMAVTYNSLFFDKDDLTKSTINLMESFRGSMKEADKNAYRIIDYCKGIVKSAVKGKRDSQKPDLIYSALRYYMTTNINVQGEEFYNYHNFADLNAASRNFNQIPDNLFAFLYAYFLDKHDVKSDIVMVVPEFFGDKDQAVTETELAFGVYVPITDTYYWSINNYRYPGQENVRLLGGHGFKIPYLERFEKKSRGKEFTIPFSSPAKNTSTSKIDITVADDNSMTLKRNLKLSGMYVPVYNRLLLFQTFYIKEDVKKFADASFMEKVTDFEKFGYPQKKRKFSKSVLEEKRNANEEYFDIRDERIDDWIKSNFEADEILDFETINYGVSKKDPDLAVSMEFTSDDYIKKAGPNLIFELGRLITGQIEVTEEEKEERKQDVHFDFSKVISNDITITLPEGLVAHGLDAFQFNVDNPVGKFVSTVSQEGNVLKVNTEKVYKKSHVPLEKWNEITKMLEAAYQFTQQKTILKKG